MRDQVTLRVTSVLATLLFALHWSDEISRGMETGNLSHFAGVLILIVWLAGPLVFGEGRVGYIIMLVGGILGLGVLVIHMNGAGLLRGRIANTSGIFFWVFTAIALGVTSAIAGILAARGLWRLQRGRSG
jgi:hypothetical protein